MDNNDITVFALNFCVYTGLLQQLDEKTQKELDEKRAERFKKFEIIDATVTQEIADAELVIEQAIIAYMNALEDKIYDAMEYRLNASQQV